MAQPHAPQPSVPQYLSHTCAMLKNAAPQEWAAFLEAFGASADEVTLQVTDASPDTVLVAQGCARQMIVLLKIYLACKPWVPPAAAPPTPLPAA